MGNAPTVHYVASVSDQRSVTDRLCGNPVPQLLYEVIVRHEEGRAGISVLVIGPSWSAVMTPAGVWWVLWILLVGVG